MPTRIALALATVAATLCAPVRAAPLEVDISHVRPTKSIQVSVYRDAESWRAQRNPIATRTVPARAIRQTVRIDDLPPGRYAVRVKQAPNHSGLAEIPNFAQERSGTSGALSRTGIGSFERAAVDVGEEGARVRVHLFVASSF